MHNSSFLLAFLVILLCVSSLFPCVGETADPAFPLFTGEEKAFLREHPVLRLGVGTAFPPFMYVTSGKEPGELQFRGMVKEYIALMEKKLGVRMEPVLDISFPEALERARNRQLDVFPCIAKTLERSEYLEFTAPYISYPLVILTRAGTPFIGRIEDLSGMRVAVVKALATYSKLQSDFPDLDIEYIFLEKYESVLQAVSMGQADACIANLAVAAYMINNQGLSNLRVAAPAPWPENRLRMAVRNDWPILVSIIQKALDSISFQEHAAIRQKWIDISIDDPLQLPRVRQWLIYVAVAVAAGGIPLILWIVLLRREVARRKGVEQELNDINRQLQRQLGFNEVLLKAIPTPVFFKDLQGRYLGCNQAFTEFMGVAPEQIRGKTVYELWPSEHAKVYHEKDLELLRNPERQVYEFKVKDKHGAERDVIYSKDVFYDEQGMPAGIVGGFLDISKRKKAEKDLFDMNRRLEQLVEERTRELAAKAEELTKANKQLLAMDEMKSTFLTSVSHELRTPLTSILGFAKMVTKDFRKHFNEEDHSHGRFGARILDNLLIVENEAKRLTRLINDVLDLSKIEAGHMQWKDKDVMFSDVMALSEKTVSGLFISKPFTFVRDVDVEGVRLHCDPDRIMQVLINLLDNAAKFTPKGEILLQARKLDDCVRVTVRDSGPGIPQDDLERVFDKFHQLIPSDTLAEVKTKGTGLGLAICKQIVEHYGGRIWAESPPGQGASFHFELPL